MTLFHAEEIQVPGSTPCTIVKRVDSKGKGKKKKPGRIVVSREQVFDAIDEWPCRHGEDSNILLRKILLLYADACQDLLFHMLHLHEEESCHQTSKGK